MEFALLLHLVSVILGFGAVLSVDFIGLKWMLGKKKLADVIAISSNAQPLIWLGYAGLITSGLFLHPDLGKTRVVIKMIAVVLAGLNGVNLHFVQKRSKELASKTIKNVPFKFLVWSTVSISLSQLFWWTAIIVGFLSASQH